MNGLQKYQKSQISKRIMWIISKSHREKKIFFDIFAIHLTSRYEKRCRMLQRLFSLFQGSKNQLCIWHLCPTMSDVDVVLNKQFIVAL